jgi:hypothetical protein
MRRQSKDHIPNMREAVTGGAFTAVFATLGLVALDHWDSGLSWGSAVRSEAFYFVFMLVGMTAFFYHWPRRAAKRQARQPSG